MEAGGRDQHQYLHGSHATITSGTLQLGNGTSGQDGSIYYTSRITNNGALVYDLAGPQTYGGVISGGGSLTKLGGGTLILTNTDSAATTTISGGTLQLGVGSYGNDGTLSGPITDNSVLVANYFGTQTLSGLINGSGTLTKSGPGTLILTSADSYGVSTVSAGTLQLGNGTTNGSVSSNVSLALGAGLAFDNGSRAGLWRGHHRQRRADDARREHADLDRFQRLYGRHDDLDGHAADWQWHDQRRALGGGHPHQ